jgi:hypothetical protein
MTIGRLTFRVHALIRMAERAVSTENVRHVLETGDVIALYLDDRPYASRLVLGWRGGRPLHVVAADTLSGDEIIVITVYEPDPELWDQDFKRRLKR